MTSPWRLQSPLSLAGSQLTVYLSPAVDWVATYRRCKDFCGVFLPFLEEVGTPWEHLETPLAATVAGPVSPGAVLSPFRLDLLFLSVPKPQKRPHASAAAGQ